MACIYQMQASRCRWRCSPLFKKNPGFCGQPDVDPNTEPLLHRTTHSHIGKIWSPIPREVMVLCSYWLWLVAELTLPNHKTTSRGHSFLIRVKGTESSFQVPELTTGQDGWHSKCPLCHLPAVPSARQWWLTLPTSNHPAVMAARLDCWRTRWKREVDRKDSAGLWPHHPPSSLCFGPSIKLI